MSVIHLTNFDLSTVSKDTIFVLDTNVLYYVHSGYNIPNNWKTRAYSNLIQELLINSRNVVVSALSV